LLTFVKFDEVNLYTFYASISDQFWQRCYVSGHNLQVMVGHTYGHMVIWWVWLIMLKSFKADNIRFVFLICAIAVCELFYLSNILFGRLHLVWVIGWWWMGFV